jgi:hypothetical protein
MKNTLDDLRNHLFATIEALQDPDKPMELDRAKAINQTAQTLNNSAKVEVADLDATGQEGAGKFFSKLSVEEGRAARPRLQQPC